MKLRWSRDPRPQYAGLAFFEGWCDADLARLERLAEVLEYEPGEVLRDQARVVPEFLVVVSGHADVLEDSEPARSVGPGETLGELGLLAGAQRPAAVVARTHVTALYLGPREFHGLLTEAPSLGRALSQVLANRLARLPASA